MKKQLIIIGITLVLLAVGLSGCNEKSTDGLEKSNEEKILGAWGEVVPGEEEISIFDFFSNGTFSISAMVLDFWSNSNIRQTIWGTYVITDETLAMEVKGDTNALKCSFSDNGKKLTLIAVEQGGQFAVLTKYDSPPSIPSIQFIKNNENYTLTVSAVDPSDVPWSNIEITGMCNTSSLGTYVRIGDMITGCSGTITIRDTPTNILLGTWNWTFTAETSQPGKWLFALDTSSAHVGSYEAYSTGYIPTLVIIDINGDIIHKSAGVHYESGLLDLIQQAQNPGDTLGPAPDFTLETFNGETFTLSDHQGKVVILDIMAVRCPPCKTQMPELHNVKLEKGDDIVILSIDVDAAYGYETENDVRDAFGEYIKEYAQ